MTEWINDTPSGWIESGRKIYEAWEAYCEGTGDPVEALEPDHPDHHIFEEWMAGQTDL